MWPGRKSSEASSSGIWREGHPEALGLGLGFKAILTREHGHGRVERWLILVRISSWARWAFFHLAESSNARNLKGNV